MPSFDVVSEVNHHELTNAVDQANREVSTRFDFKGTGSNFELSDQLRVTGKKRDDLQTVITLLKEEKFGLPLQFKNFRD